MSNVQIGYLKWDEDVTLKNLDQFKDKVNQFILGNDVYLILNIANVSYVNSAALGVIADAVMKSKANNKEFVVTNIQPSVKEIFDIVKFDTFMKFFEIESDAINYFKNK